MKSIEAQHGLLIERARGIYSFSHLTFQEYFTARQIKEKCSNEALNSLSIHVTEKRWREVFLLVVEMLPSAEALLQLMKHQIDSLLAGDEKLQQFFTWVERKSHSVEASYKPAAVRAFYFTLAVDSSFDYSNTLPVILNNYCGGFDGAFDRAFASYFASDFNYTSDSILAHAIGSALVVARYRTRDFGLVRVLDPSLSLAALNSALVLDHLLVRYIEGTLILARHLDVASRSSVEGPIDLDSALALDRYLKLDSPDTLSRALDTELQRKLKQLRKQLPDTSNPNWRIFKQWWQANGQGWFSQLKAVIIHHCDIGHDWQFSNAQNKLLQQYYDANMLLVNCLNSDCYVSREVRQSIEDALLLRKGS